MTVTIELLSYTINDPFLVFAWDIDFAAGGAPDLVFDEAPFEDPLSIYYDNDGIRTWMAAFQPAVEWSAIEGKNAADLLSDGATIIASSQSDRLLMTEFAEKVAGGYGSDLIDGRGGNDHLKGEDGEDILYGGPGDDILEGGDGDDVLNGGPGADTLIGGDGSDTYRIDQFDTIVETESDWGTDTVEASFSYAAAAFIENVRLLGSAHIDATGNEETNVIWGNAGHNVLRGGGGDDDQLYGGTGDDTLYGSHTGWGNVLYGGPGDDHLVGGKYDDELRGGDGDDVLHPGRGEDELWGGAGADQFVLLSQRGYDFRGDVVHDFSRAEGDRIALELSAYRKLKKTGLLKKKYFDAGNKRADDKNDYLVYHKKKGDLYYDKDGSGSKKAVLIADFDKGTKLKAADIDVI